MSSASFRESLNKMLPTNFSLKYNGIICTAYNKLRHVNNFTVKSVGAYSNTL